MTETIFAIGVFVFALTVWGTVMAGSMALSRQMDEDGGLAAERRPTDS
ncbi:MAG: hypothetical protein O3C27_01570 [Actinomycetota bacterium]|nr:hypothetical protein [Actinomycetota bacterium]